MIPSYDRQTLNNDTMEITDNEYLKNINEDD